MPLRFLVLAVASITFLSSCSLGDPPAGPGEVTVEVETPDRVDWKRTVGGIEIAGVDTRADSDELELLEAALSEIPDALIVESGVRTIYRVRSDPDAIDAEALAFARGPDIYITDETFRRASGRLAMADILAHELAHTLQFRSITEEDLKRLSGIIDLDVYGRTAFVGQFAADVGWEQVGSGDSAGWVLRNIGGTTPYGATSPAEDMADTIARVALGRSAEVSGRRVEWAENLMGRNIRDLASGKPYVPSGAVQVAPRTPLYDERRAAQLSRGHIEPRSFTLPSSSPSTPQLAREIQDELARRGLAGRLENTGDEAVARYAGEFVRGDGVQFLVELWDFRDAPGYTSAPAQPVLTYVTLW